MKSLFVYGTLQPGGRLYEYWIVHAVVGEPQKGKISGRLYHVTDDGPVYPVAKLTPWLEDSSEIVGTVLPVDENHPAYKATEQMEKNAGYTVLEEVPCELADGSVIKVVAFHYIWEPGGRQIDSGDWFAEIGQS